MTFEDWMTRITARGRAVLLWNKLIITRMRNAKVAIACQPVAGLACCWQGSVRWRISQRIKVRRAMMSSLMAAKP